jgi:hypothetical protein
MPRYQTHFAYPTLNFTAQEELDSLVEEAFAEEGWDMGDPYRTPGRPPPARRKSLPRSANTTGLPQHAPRP